MGRFMQKCICDICDKNIADKKYKIKQEKELAHFEYGFAFPRTEWVEIDICEKCYKKLVAVKNFKNTEDRIMDSVLKLHDSYKVDFKIEEAFLMGAQAAINAIDPKIIFDTRAEKL